MTSERLRGWRCARWQVEYVHALDAGRDVCQMPQVKRYHAVQQKLF